MDDESEGIAEQYEHRKAYPITRKVTDMQTFRCELREKTVCFHFNSDLSDDVMIKRDDDNSYMSVPGIALIKFMGMHIRNKKIGELEQMEPEELLGIK